VSTNLSRTSLRVFDKDVIYFDSKVNRGEYFLTLGYQFDIRQIQIKDKGTGITGSFELNGGFYNIFRIFVYGLTSLLNNK
jgi:hypothetical protein